MFILYLVLAFVAFVISSKLSSKIFSIIAFVFFALAADSFRKYKSRQKDKAINEQIRQNTAVNQDTHDTEESHNNEANAADSRPVPNDVLIERLRPYDDVRKCTCPYCGYTGLVGVKKIRHSRGFHFLDRTELFCPSCQNKF